MKTVETATRNYARKCLMAFLEGDKSLNWLLGVVRSSGVRGSRLSEVFDGLRDYGDRGRYEEAAAACRRHGWLP
jgi:hypothetical protein